MSYSFGYLHTSFSFSQCQSSIESLKGHSIQIQNLFFLSFTHPQPAHTLPFSSYLVCSLSLSPVSVWNDSEQEATPNTMLIRLEGSLPAITRDLRSSSPLISPFSPSVQPQTSLLPLFLPFISRSACQLQTSSSPPFIYNNTLSFFFCSQNFRKQCAGRMRRRNHRKKKTQIGRIRRGEDFPFTHT